MKKASKLLGLLVTIVMIYACGRTITFEEQITNDITSKMGTGICDSIPSGSIIKNVKIGEITPIGKTGLIDVSLEFDIEVGQDLKHKSEAVLYSKQGDNYYLEALGGCEYRRKR